MTGRRLSPGSSDGDGQPRHKNRSPFPCDGLTPNVLRSDDDNSNYRRIRSGAEKLSTRALQAVLIAPGAFGVNRWLIHVAISDRFQNECPAFFDYKFYLTPDNKCNIFQLIPIQL